MANNGGFKCEFIDSVFERFYCKKCTLVARKLTVAECCKKSFCKTCIADILEQGQPCPECEKQEFSTSEQIEDQKQINNLRVYCSMKERGCVWYGTLDLLDIHLDPHGDYCQYVDTKCPLNCLQTFPKNKMDQHVAQECSKRPHVCQHCGFKATYKEVVDTHLPECKYVPLQCFNMCEVSCDREVMEDHKKICRLEEVECEFSSVGHDSQFMREDQDEHFRQNSQKHLTLTASLALETKEQFQQKLLQQEKKHKEEEAKLMNKIDDQNKKLEALEKKLRRQENMLQKEEEMLGEQEKSLGEKEKNQGKQEKKLGKQEKKLGEQEKKLVEQEKKLGQEEKKLEEQEKKLGKQEKKLGEQENKLVEQEKKRVEQEKKLEQQEKKLEEQDKKLGKQEKKLGEQEKKLGEQEKNLVEQEKKLEKQEKKLGEQEKKLGEQEKKLGEQEKKLGEQEKRLGEQEKKLGKQEKLGEQEKKLVEQEKKLVEQEKKLVEQEKKLGEQEKKLGEQQEKLGEQEKKLGEQEKKVMEQEKKLVEEEKQLGETKEKIGSQEKKLGEQEKKLLDQDKKLGEHKKMIHELTKSQQDLIVKVSDLIAMTGTNRKFEMNQFSTKRRSRSNYPNQWKSPPMYTHVCGYKFCIGVCAHMTTIKDCIGMDLLSMPGEYDDQLTWPRNVKVKLELVNQRDGNNTGAETVCILKKPVKPFEHMDWILVVHHSKLLNYLFNDTLYFHISSIELL